MRRRELGPDLNLDHQSTRSSHLPVVSYPQIAKALPRRALPVPKRAASRRLAPRVRPQVDQLLASLKTTMDPPIPRKAPRLPTLKAGKRARPVWRPPNEDNLGEQHVATEPRKRSTSEHGPMFEAQGKKKLMSPAACVSFHPFAETLS